MAESQSQALPPRYQLHGQLGAGGSGRVYKVYDSIRKLDLALKLVSPAESTWLRREFETLRQIRHENLMQVFDWGSLPSGDSYYTMEFVEGGEWGRRLVGPQPPDEVLRILRGILRGVAHLHSHGEVHGDLKPGNVLLGSSTVRVSDVGMGGSAVATSQSGTPGYSAPEIWEGARPNVQTDLYSVGIMAYEALAGRHPFEGKTVRDVVSGQLVGWVPSLAALGIVVPVGLERAIMRSLERAPSLREASADEFLQVLDVEDPVGEILGGRFVDRTKELALAEEFLSPGSSHSPSILYVSGAPGTGKTAFIEEVLDRAVARGMQLVRTSSGFSDFRIEMQRPATAPDSAATDLGISEIAASLWESAQTTRVVCRVELRSGSGRDIERVRNLGRYVSEFARETMEPCRVLIVVELHDSAPVPEEFERAVLLEPLAEGETGLLVEGLLGSIRLEPGVMAWVQASTGGVPAQVTSTVMELIDQRLLTRREGSWFFRETGRLREFRARTSNRWEIAWTHLPEDSQKVLVFLAWLQRGLMAKDIRLVTDRARDVLSDLIAKGWVLNRDGVWRIISEDARRVVREFANPSLAYEVRDALIQQAGTLLNREERAVLLLAQQTSGAAIDEGLWASELSASRGDFGPAADRARAALELAVRRKDYSRARQASLLLATALHHSGDDFLAKDCLEDARLWRDKEIVGVESASRERLIGMIWRALGELDQARDRLESAVQLSNTVADSRGVFQATAELAEIEWRYGDEDTRKKAIARIRAALEQNSEGMVLEEERAALRYQLGAALVTDGRQDEAADVLRQGLEAKSGPYWKMRLSNALSSALYYMGKFNAALEQLDRAWQLAEQGGIDSFRARILSNRAGDYYGLGKFRDAVDQHALSARWARRTGNMFEYLAACTGSSVNQLILARYEQAIGHAQEARKVAERLGDQFEFAKSFELESLARFHVGDYESSWSLLKEGELVMERFGFAEVKPRLLWQRARLETNDGNVSESERLLQEAEELLAKTKDWEDLPGVRIDLQIIQFADRNTPSSIERVRQISAEAERTGALVVRLRGAIAVGEMVMKSGAEERDVVFLGEALGSAEQAGALEFGWRLSHLLGELSIKRGDIRGASSRFAHAIRGLREVADELSPPNRDLYLRTPHALALLARVS